MTHELHDLREMLQSELIKVAQKGITVNNLEMIDKLSHSIKSIDTIIAMDDSGYSEARGGYSYARRRDSRGRYSNTNGYLGDRDMYSRTGSMRNSYDGYSRAEAKEGMMAQLQDMLNQTSDFKLRTAIQKALDTMEMD